MRIESRNYLSRMVAVRLLVVAIDAEKVGTQLYRCEVADLCLVLDKVNEQVGTILTRLIGNLYVPKLGKIGVITEKFAHCYLCGLLVITTT